MYRTTLYAFAIAATALAATACGGGSEPTAPDRSELLRAEAQWNAAGIQDYNYDLVTSFAAAHDSVQVQVRNNQVTLSKSYLSGQTTPTGTTVVDLFDSIDAAILSGLKVDVTYDPQFGYPATGSVSPQYNTPAGPSSWAIVHFAPAP